MKSMISIAALLGCLLLPSGCQGYLIVEKRQPRRRVTVVEHSTNVETGVTESTTTVYVDRAPPPPPVVFIPSCPGPDYIWIEGHYRWTGTRYVWVRGYWVTPPRRRAVWVGGGWRRRPRGWVYVGGSWWN